MKKKRDTEVAASIKKENSCLCCGSFYQVEGHHVKSFGSGGPCLPENMAPVCRVHHGRWHNKGSVWMADTWPRVRKWLISNGWEIVTYGDGTKKWKNYNIERMIREKSCVIGPEYFMGVLQDE